MPKDPKQRSHKFNHGACKYEIALSLSKSNSIWVNGPFRGAEHDITVMRRALLHKIPFGKFAIGDGGYTGKTEAEKSRLSNPSKMDPPFLNNFKSCARLRHETFNGRLKCFAALSTTYNFS